MLDIGYNAKIYINTGAYATPTWAEITVVGDLSHNSSHAEADATTRGGGGEEAVIAAITSRSIEFDVKYDTSDTNVVALEDAYYAKTVLDVAVMSGDIATTGSRGFRADTQVFQWNKSEPLAEAQNVAAILKPTYSANAPTKMVIA